MVLMILGCFTICWLPYFIVACSQIYKLFENSSAVAYMAAFTLAMSNSAMNPLIYAWKNTNFRNAFINLLKCKSPDTLEPSQSMRSNLHRKSSSAQHQDQLGAFPNYSTPPFMQRKIEPINAMGITFEEDEDKVSTHEALSAKANNINSSMVVARNNNPPPVTIKIETDMKSSIVIMTAALSESPGDALSTENTNDDFKAQSEDGETTRTGNLIVNQLMENYGYDSTGDDLAKFKDNFLNINDHSCIDGSSKMKSKSTNSIAITKSPNKSNSHGSIFDFTHSKHITNDKTNESLDSSSEGKALNKNLFPAFNFGRKYVSKSFNSSTSAQRLDNCNGNCTKPCRKSADINFQA